MPPRERRSGIQVMAPLRNSGREGPILGIRRSTTENGETRRRRRVQGPHEPVKNALNSWALTVACDVGQGGGVRPTALVWSAPTLPPIACISDSGNPLPSRLPARAASLKVLSRVFQSNGMLVHGQAFFGNRIQVPRADCLMRAPRCGMRRKPESWANGRSRERPPRPTVQFRSGRCRGPRARRSGCRATR